VTETGNLLYEIKVEKPFDEIFNVLKVRLFLGALNFSHGKRS
jgi:hypothetical protein